MTGERYQYALITLGTLSCSLIALFFAKELFPEYKLYQGAYIALEEFRSSYTGEPPPSFSEGVRQLVLPRSGEGSPPIDRCTSCHVALTYPHFSPTRLLYNNSGELLRDRHGIPLQAENEEYIWKKVDEAIHAFEASGDSSAAERLRRLKTAEVGEKRYDMTRVLRAHPLIGQETRPFEHHPQEEYGCVACHNGNGRGLTSDKAHGPIWDGQYEIEFMGYEPKFLEEDPKNDPPFSHAFNHKPGHELLFQTTPLFVGKLIEARCMQCHQGGDEELSSASMQLKGLLQRRNIALEHIQAAYGALRDQVASLLILRTELLAQGFTQTLQKLNARYADFSLPEEERKRLYNLSLWLERATAADAAATAAVEADKTREAVTKLEAALFQLIEEPTLASILLEASKKEFSFVEAQQAIDQQVEQELSTGTPTGRMVLLKQSLLQASNERSQTKASIGQVEALLEAPELQEAFKGSMHQLLSEYYSGEELFFSQACYACHRIAGESRGGVGPDLTYAGLLYPWYLKQSIVWPQADLKTSTMPNFHLDHEELEKLMTYLLGQQGGNRLMGAVPRKIALQHWEAGNKRSFEQPLTPAQIMDPSYAEQVFATEGCASCHRLKADFGASSPPKQDEKAARLWFIAQFPEMISGKQLATTVHNLGKQIEEQLAGLRANAPLLEELEQQNPGLLASYYAPFKYASRAYDHLLDADGLAEYKARLQLVLFSFIQEYGLGRLIAPRLNWSGVYRSEEWLMEHFRKPTGHVPRSLMPSFPFDTTKFYALTRMLQAVGKRNREQLHGEWATSGFQPEAVYATLCAQCHGTSLQGNGPVAEWIYPAVKNLRNAPFLQGLGRDRIINSLLHGVKGTPMPPWGEAAVQATDTLSGEAAIFSEKQAGEMADWLLSLLPSTNGSAQSRKWKYGVDEVLKELQKEGLPLGDTPSPASSGFFPFSSPVPLHRVEQKAVSLPTRPDELFDIEPGKEAQEARYTIKQKFYTAENLSGGKEFFGMNCAVCHGKDGDGAGARASIMRGAKPRILTNLDWISSYDDLQLLRWIVYGVEGTSMPAWGAETTAVQRLQLVMYIRQLSAEAARHAAVDQLLYRTFDAEIQPLQLVESSAAGSSKERKRSAAASRIALLTQEKQEAEVLLSGFLPLANDLIWKELLQLVGELGGRYRFQEGGYQFTAVAMPLAGSEELLAAIKEQSRQEKETPAWKEAENLFIETLAAFQRLQQQETTLESVE